MRNFLAGGLAAAVLVTSTVPVLAGGEATKSEIVAAFVGKTLQFENGDTFAYAPDGGYTYTALKPSKQFKGWYTIGNGFVCVQFVDGGARCDTILTDGRFFMFVNTKGQRYLAIPESTLPL